MKYEIIKEMPGSVASGTLFIIPPSRQVRSLFRKGSRFEPDTSRTGISYHLQIHATLVLVDVAVCLGN